jgi:hypothetical protein
MNRPDNQLLNSNSSKQESRASGLQLWSAIAFAIFQLFVLESIAILRSVRSNEPLASPEMLNHIIPEMFAPLMVCVLGILAYRRIMLIVQSVDGDPTILRAVALNGSIVLGFAFLTMDLIL